MTILYFILFLVALVLFGLASIGTETPRLNFVAAGLALVTLALVIQQGRAL